MPTLRTAMHVTGVLWFCFLLLVDADHSPWNFVLLLHTVDDFLKELLLSNFGLLSRLNGELL